MNEREELQNLKEVTVSATEHDKGVKHFSDLMKKFARAEMHYLVHQEQEGQDVDFAKSFLHVWWALIVHNTKGENGWLMLENPPPTGDLEDREVPADVVTQATQRGLFQCESSCPAKALFRVYLHKVGMELDLCRHHYQSLDTDHAHTVLLDRSSVLGHR